MSRQRIETYARLTLCIIACVIYLMPLFWMVSTSLKPVDQIFQKPPVLFPSSPQLESYKSVSGLAFQRAGTLYKHFCLFQKFIAHCLVDHSPCINLSYPGCLCTFSFQISRANHLPALPAGLSDAAKCSACYSTVCVI